MAYLSLKEDCWNSYDVCQEILKKEVMRYRAFVKRQHFDDCDLGNTTTVI